MFKTNIENVQMSFQKYANAAIYQNPRMEKLHIAGMSSLFRQICPLYLLSSAIPEIHLLYETATQAVPGHVSRAGVTISLAPRRSAAVLDTCRTHRARR